MEEKDKLILVTSLLLGLFALVATVAGTWKSFEKAGYAGWKLIIPIYGFYITCKIAKLSGWFTVLLFIPFVNYIAAPFLYFKFARAFKKSTLFCVGNASLVLTPLMMLIIGFGDSQYSQESNSNALPESAPAAPPK